MTHPSSATCMFSPEGVAFANCVLTKFYSQGFKKHKNCENFAHENLELYGIDTVVTISIVQSDEALACSSSTILM